MSRRTPVAPALAVLLLLGCATPPPAPAPTPTPAPPPAAAASPPAPAPASAPTDDERFARWLAGFRVQARAAGIDEATLDAALAGARYLPRVVEQDRAQSEFTRAVWDYLDRAVSPARVARGGERLPLADAAAARFGVPAAVLVAIWGIESDYGQFSGDIPVVSALATLGVDGRREAWARSELLAALRIVRAGDVVPERLLGSWAGAIGQNQLLPSNFLAYAVDGDGDGRRDLWTDIADVTASTAHLLARAGWRADEPWAAEVRLPEGFDLARADGALRQDSAAWAAEGVRAADGSALPAIADAVIHLPAGARGPAFLAGANFRALLRYNNALSYALAVGLLSQRLAGGPGVLAAWPRDLAPLSRSQLKALQEALNARGFDSGAADGVLGPATRGALRRWQRSTGLPADGYPTLELLQRLQSS